MPRTSHVVKCVVNDASYRKLTAPDAVVVIVIMVLACVLANTGRDTDTTVTLLAGASCVAAGTLLALRGDGRQLGQLMVRLTRALPTQ
ncbi:LPXTG cell wall anchor domain-containing protein [Streptomyces sp. NPDC060235]|uniref:LPXTG cell wall anchor domain-containing protein n=1 Tax=Streptomyces sp. NPDC060235 TaxID=3347080 RepID=UPI003661B9BC